MGPDSVIPVQRQGLVMSLVVGIQGQKASRWLMTLCKTPICAELVVPFSAVPFGLTQEWLRESCPSLG